MKLSNIADSSDAVADKAGGGTGLPRSAARELHLSPATSSQAHARLKVLASEPRLRILDLLGDNARNITEIAEALEMPLSTVTMHVRILADVDLIRVESKPGARGTQRICTRTFDKATLEFPVAASRRSERTSTMLEMPIPLGSFTRASVSPSCGLLSDTGIIGLLDDPATFVEPERVHAQLLWFREGFVEYRIPHRLSTRVTVQGLQVEMEVCSEAPLHNNEWPSDITLWINGIEVGTWTSPGDFGGTRGLLTPEWWNTEHSQYGVLKVWSVSRSASFLDGHIMSQNTVSDLDLTARPYVDVRIGVKSEARHVGGVNLFGRSFGHYPQDIVFRLFYT